MSVRVWHTCRNAPVLFISAQTGQRVDKSFRSSTRYTSRTTCAFRPADSTPFAEVTARVQPPNTDKGPPSAYLLHDGPPPARRHFVCFCNDARVCSVSPISAYLENQIRRGVRSDRYAGTHGHP